MTVLLIASILFAVPALHAAQQPAVPRIELQPFRLERGDEPAIEVEKGWLTVPESRKRPGSRTLKLAFIRLKATGEKPGPPLVFLAGGPGASGIQGCRDWGFPICQALREFGDVIAFDQRGTGESEPAMECSDTPPRNLPLDRPIGREEYLAAWIAQSRHCAETMRQRGIDLAAYNTEENADDLDDLRRALGAEKISLWGTSYGTRLALTMIRRHGPHVHRTILAGVDSPDQTEKLPHQHQEMLAVIAAMVKTDPQAGSVVPDLLGLMRTVLTRLEKEPAYVTVPDPRTGQTFRVGISKLDVQAATAELLTGPDFFAALPDLYFRMAAGDWLPMAYKVIPQRTGRIPSAMAFAMECSSGASAARRKRIAEEAKSALLADVINFPLPDVCAAWGVPDLGDAFRAPVVSDIPALFISGSLDGRTPLENAEEVLRGFKNGVHLVLENAGHGDPLFLSSPKILESIQTFLRGQPLSATRIEIPAPRFQKPRKVIELAPEVLAKYVGSYRIDDSAARRIFLVGNQLFSQRTGADPIPLRPFSETQFFYEGLGTEASFRLSADGKPTHMVLHVSGGEQVTTKMELVPRDQALGMGGAADPSGLWNGWVVYAPGQTEVEVTVELGKSYDGSWVGTIDVPVQNLEFVPLVQVAVKGSQVSFDLVEPSGTTAFSGQLSPDGAQLRGEIRENGAVHPFLLERKPDRPTPKPTGPLRSLSETGAELKTLFDQESGKVRLIFLISPTCPRCIIAARLLERYLLDQVPGDQLRVYVIWGPMLGDETEAAARSAMRHLPDERVLHFWTSSPALAKSLAVLLGLKETAAWDVFLLFAAGARWTDPAPRPDSFMHQRGDLLPADRTLDAAKLRDHVRELLASRESGAPAPRRP